MAVVLGATLLVPTAQAATPSATGDAPATECRLPRDPSIGNESEGLTNLSLIHI